MHINSSNISYQIKTAYQHLVEQSGKLAHRSIHVLRQIAEVIKNYQAAAVGTVVLANLFFFETALRITRLVDFTVVRLKGPEDNWSTKALNVKSIAIVGIFFGNLTAANLALYRILPLPLSALEFTLVSIATQASYIFIQLAKAHFSNPN